MLLKSSESVIKRLFLSLASLLDEVFNYQRRSLSALCSDCAAAPSFIQKISCANTESEAKLLAYLSWSVNGSVLPGTGEVYGGGGMGWGWRQTDRHSDLQPDAISPHILCLPFVMHPPHLRSCHWPVRTNHGMRRRLPAVYQFGQDDIKFLVLRVKDHMKTDVLITGSPVL